MQDTDPLCFDAQLADASGSAALCFWSICFMRFHMRCNLKTLPNIGEVSFVSAFGPMSRCSRWPVGDYGPPRPLGPMHSVTISPPLATPDLY